MADAISTSLQSCMEGWAAQLAVDAARTAPQIDYSLDGESVSREAWRAGLMAKIEAAQRLINARNPFCVVTEVRVR